jgi:small conductance mechanosensitive channel
VRALLLEITRDDPDYLDSPVPKVVVTSLNDYNVALQLQAWLRDERLHIQKRTELRERVFETLRSADVEVPFETLALAPVDVRTRAA